MQQSKKLIENNLSILVNSCDSYCDCWEPFFKLLKKYGSGIEKSKIFLNTESLQYRHMGLHIIQCNCENIQWGGRVQNAVEQIDTDYILFFLDDFFIRDYVNTDKIVELIRIMNLDKSIGCIYLCKHPYAIKDNKYNGLDIVPHNAKYRISAQCAIWKKDILKTSILSSESPWQWEIYGSERNSVLLDKIKFYALSDSMSTPIEYGLRTWQPWGIVQGKWCRDDVCPFFEAENISIDYDVRGFYQSNNTTDLVVLETKPKKYISANIKGTYLFRCIKKIRDSIYVFYRLIYRIVLGLTGKDPDYLNLVVIPVVSQEFKFIKDKAKKVLKA